MDSNCPDKTSETDSETSCSFTSRENRKYAKKRKRKDEEPEPQADELPGKRRRKKTAQSLVRRRTTKLHPVKVNTFGLAKNRSDTSSSSTPRESRKYVKKRKKMNKEPELWPEELPANRRGTETQQSFMRRQKSESHHMNVNTFRLAKFYTLGKLLGKGSFGSVYEAVRNSDGKKLDGKKLPLEVVLMNLVCKPPCCPYVINLLEWFETPVSFVYVLELPNPCIDLYEYCKTQHGQISEWQAKHIMQQVIQATCHCKDRAVFHGDIRLNNVLLNTQTMQVKLIDFGCGSLYQGRHYTECDDSLVFLPISWVSGNVKMLDSCTVRQLGFVLHCLVGGTWRPGKVVFGKKLSEGQKGFIGFIAEDLL
ncbi:Serine/threonine-protein kinase pim-1 [Bagarius yarrelli]|uniref:non-specific serine/threonine protein kinase n=1 Tax=Bagarius yarrelli TaxID=175774 RepID=A0A556TKH7_BAGYA|nr:Serine/threonine-protein kinase pim-1 [Bagarius yarrelli]